MRVFLFLLALIASLGIVVLAYFGFTGALSFVYYMLISSGISILLAFICSHFMYTSWRNRRREKEAEKLNRALESEKREIAAKRTSLEAELLAHQAKLQDASDLNPDLTQKIMMTIPSNDKIDTV